MANEIRAGVHPLWSDDETTVAHRMMLLEAARARAKRERGVTLTDLAEALGISQNRLSRWFHMPPKRLSGAATNMMDEGQVRATCELLDVGIDYLLRGVVEQPLMPPAVGPSDAEPDRYVPHRLCHAYMALSDENQRKVTAYVSDLLRLQQAEREVALQAAEGVTVGMLGQELADVMLDHLGGDVPDGIEVALDSYLGAAQHYRGRWAAGDAQADRGEAAMASWYWDRAAEYHKEASDRGRKPDLAE